MSLHKIISDLVSKLKKEEFLLDSNIPLNYLLLFLVNKYFFLLNGLLVLRKVSYISPKSVIKCRSKIEVGANFSVDKFCHIDALSESGIKAGNNVSIGKNTVIECSGSMKCIGKGLCIGNNVGLGTHGFLGCAGGIEIGNDVIMGNYVSMHSENHNFNDLELPIRVQGVSRKGIRIGNNCWIGAKVTILDGAVIGDGSIVAAGAVVRGVFPANSVIGGVPARIIKSRV